MDSELLARMEQVEADLVPFGEGIDRLVVERMERKAQTREQLQAVLLEAMKTEARMHPRLFVDDTDG